MPALNFQKQFAEKVENGTKTQSIRAIRKDWVKKSWEVGDKLYLYTGMRTKQCRKLGEGKIKEIKVVTIMKDCILVDNWFTDSLVALDTLAVDDGFNSFDEMRDWFDKTHGLPFYGNLIQWELINGIK